MIAWWCGMELLIAWISTKMKELVWIMRLLIGSIWWWLQISGKRRRETGALLVVGTLWSWEIWV
uniref:Uncharacterized protein n=1 Tax=Arundo donax TaxID=35708 RepID=A0A0A9AXN8_ARUDO